MISILKLLVLFLIFNNLTNAQINLSSSNLEDLCNYCDIYSTVINLSYRNIAEIEDEKEVNTFLGLKNLKDLNLSSNQLTSIKANLFQDLKNLQNINLENNKIISIDKMSFNGMLMVENINIAQNPISILFPNELNYLCNSNPKCLLILS